MEDEQSVKTISDINNFKHRLRSSVYQTYFTIFSDDPDFQDCFDEKLLKHDVICFWIDYYTMVDSAGTLTIYNSDIARLEMALYKELVQSILSKLVDMGKLIMCWDNDRMRVIWKHPSEEHNQKDI